MPRGDARPEGEPGSPSVRVGSHPANRWIVSESGVDLSRSEPRPARKIRVAAEPQDVVIDLGRTAIVVVDMQNDFCAEGGYLSRSGVDCGPAQRLIAPIDRLLQAVRPLDVPVIWLNWSVRPDRLDLGPALPHVHNHDLVDADPGGVSTAFLQSKGGWGAFAGQWGAEIVHGLHVEAQDIHVSKRRFSGFFATELDAVLRNMGVSTLFFAGVATDICVLATLQDAMFLGYDVLMMDDCVATNSPEYCVQAAKYHVKQLFGFMTRSTSLMDGIKEIDP